MEKYKKLIISQVCAAMAILAAILAWLRFEQSQSLMEPVTLSFVLFSVFLFGMEMKLIFDWLREQGKLK